MSGEMTRVAAHYARGGLTERILDALAAKGHDLEWLVPADLVPAEHFHTGGARATARFLDRIEFPPNARVLDIGCGIGGVSRAIAVRGDAQVLGIDLTPDFIETATSLSALVDLSARTEFAVGSALDPAPQDDFDIAILVHVGMNIADKLGIFRTARAALKPGGCFAIYEVMAGPTPGDLVFPVPWAGEADTSHLAAPDAYIAAAERAGFALKTQVDHRDAMLAKLETDPPVQPGGALGPHLMMGETFALKAKNYNLNLIAGRIAPVEMIFTRDLQE